jgi:hypothetical protein
VRFVEVPAKEVFVNTLILDGEEIDVTDLFDVDFSVMFEITPEGVVQARTLHDDPAPDGDAV